VRYEKGHKEQSRHRILEVAAERFRNDGIAASGLAGIMDEAGLTNGAFYPHFHSKAELVEECLAKALQEQSKKLEQALAGGGLDAAIGLYLSKQHRDNPGLGCVFAALLPELARQPDEARNRFAKLLQSSVREFASALPAPDSEAIALGLYATLIGALQLARATKDTALSDRILAAGARAARVLGHQRPNKKRSGRTAKTRSKHKKPEAADGERQIGKRNRSH